MELPSFSGFAKDSPSEISDNLKERTETRYHGANCNSLREWMCWNGVYIYAYGCSLAGIICALFSPLSNMYQGNNLFPYVSEVIRTGVPKRIFIIGCSIGLIPTLCFATNYLITAHDYNQLEKNKGKRIIYELFNLIIYLCFIYSAFSVIGVSICDMDHYSEWHTLWSFSWVIITNVMSLIQFFVVLSNVYTNERYDKKYIMTKLLYLLLSIFGMANFAILGSYVPCHSFHITMDECLAEFSEEYCFSRQVAGPNNPDLIVYRYYGHCPILHFCRGVGEFLAVVCTMFYLTTIVYDVKYMRSLLIERTDVSTCVGIYDDSINQSS